MPIDILEVLKNRYAGQEPEPQIDLNEMLASGAKIEYAPKPKKGLIGETIKEFEALPLTAAQVATGLAGDVAAGWTGLATGTAVDIANFLAPEAMSKHEFFKQGGMLAAEDAMRYVKEHIPTGTWPYSSEGELAKKSARQQEYIAKPFQIIRESSDWWGKKVAKATGKPELGAVVSLAIEGSTLFLGPKLAKSALGSAEPVFNVSRDAALRLKRKINRATRTGDYSDTGLIKAAEDILAEARKDPAMMAEVERYMRGEGQPTETPPPTEPSVPPTTPKQWLTNSQKIEIGGAEVEIIPREQAKYQEAILSRERELNQGKLTDLQAAYTIQDTTWNIRLEELGYGRRAIRKMTGAEKKAIVDEQRVNPNAEAFPIAPPDMADISAALRRREAEPIEAVVYHGTGMPLREGVVEERMSFSPDREVAEAYAANRGEIEGNAPKMYKAKIRFENPKVIRTEDRVGSDWYEEAKAAGHDGVVITENGKPIEYVTIKPSTVKKIAGRRPKAPEITPESQAEKHGLDYAGEISIEGEEPAYQYFDPETGEYFKSNTPESVGQELESHRAATAERARKYAGVNLETYATKLKDWYEGKGGDVQQIKQEVQDFINGKPRTDFPTSGHYVDFLDRGEELLGIINKTMREKEGSIPPKKSMVERPPEYEIKDAKPIIDPSTDIIDVEDTLKKLPPVKDGYIRLYRGQQLDPSKQITGIWEPPRGIVEDGAIGGWFTDKIHYADYFRASQGKDATIVYMDVPAEIASKHKFTQIQTEEFVNDTLVESVPTDEYLFSDLRGKAGEVDVKIHDGDIAEPKMISKEDRIAYMKQANQKRSLLKREQIEAAIEEGEDISSMLPDEAQDAYRSYLDQYERATESSEPRDFIDIFNDAKTLFEGEEGSIYIGKEPGELRGLSHDQKMALQRLVADAKRMVGDLSDYLREIGLNEKQIAFVRTQIDQMRKVEPETFGEVRQHWIDSRAIAAGDKIVKQRKPAKGRQASPVYLSEAKMIQELPNLEKSVNMKVGMSNPMRVIERLDPSGTGIKEVYYDYRQAEQLYRRESKQVRQELKDLRKGVSWKSRKRIGAYAIGQQERGLNILHKMGIKVPELTSNELRVYENLRGRYEQLFERIQTMRQMIGKEPLEKVDNYFTFFRTFGVLEKAGITFNPLLDKASLVAKTYTNYGSTPFKFGIERIKKGTMPVELDPFKVFESYSDVALRHLHLSPWVAKMNELLGVLPDLKTGKYNWILRQRNPNTYHFLRGWVDHIAGKPSELSFGPRWDRLFSRLNKNLAFAILGANARSFGIQFLALTNTVSEIGWGYTGKGIMSTIEDVFTLNGENRRFALKHSKVLDGRTYDITIEDAIRGIRGGKIGAVQDFLGRGFLKPMQLSDMETAIATWNGAYKLATDNGMSIKRAINFADDVVTRTQASALPGDLAPIQWSAFGKSATLFQTFVINNWGFLTKDVLGLGNVSISNDVALRKVIRLVAAMTAANVLLEGWGEWGGLGIQSPFPTPIKDIQESIEAGDPAIKTAIKVASGLLDPAPVIGLARYGKGPGGPVYELGTEAVRSLQGAPMAKPLPEIGGKVLGIPGTTQIGKSMRARKRGESTYGIIIGRYKPEDYAGRKRRNPLGGLKGLEELSGL